MSVKLVVLEGPSKGKAYAVDKPDMIIGRAEESDIRIGDADICRRHARITQEGDAYKLSDAGSRFGTFVNNVLLRESPLKSGDEICMGRTRLKFIMDSGIEVEPAGVAPEYQSVIVTSMAADKTTMSPPRESTLEAMKNYNARLRALLELSDALLKRLDVGKLFGHALDRIFEIIKPERAFVLLIDRETGQAGTAAVKTRDTEKISCGYVPVGRTICRKIIADREALITTDATGDHTHGSGENIHPFSIRSAMCAPLVRDDQVLGLVHVDRKGLSKCFTPAELEFLVAVCGIVQAGITP